MTWILSAGCSSQAVFHGSVSVETTSSDKSSTEETAPLTKTDDVFRDPEPDKTKPALACPEGTASVTYSDRGDFFYIMCRRPDEVQHGPWLRIWRSGEGIVERGVMADGKKHGPFSQHRTDGSLITEGEFILGEPHGLWKAAYADGQTRELITYDHGKREGPLSRWYENGTPSEETTYRKDLLHGEYRKWYENGRLEMSGAYINGRPDGEFRTWSEAGKQKGVVAVWRQGRVISARKVGR